MSSLYPHVLTRGWMFIPTHPLFLDPINYAKYLYEIYLLADPFYTGRVSLPVLWDKQTHTIVSNESSEIIRMFNSEFNHITQNTNDYYPTPLRDEIDKMNAFLYDNINNAVYECGMATKQTSYDKAFDKLFAAMDVLNSLLENQPFLVGNQLTESDSRLFVTLVRFDCVYYSHFKCNLKPLSDYKNLSRFTHQLYNMPGIAQTINFEHIKQHYYFSQVNINPTQIVPKGPLLKL